MPSITLLITSIAILFIATLMRATFGFGFGLVAMALLTLTVDLHTAAVRGDLAELTRLIEQIEQDHRPVGRTLSALLHEFRLDLICAATAPPQTRPSPTSL